MALSSTRVVLPRPDAETGSGAYNRNAHPNVPYWQWVRVQGGAYPHWFELITAPAGATLGQLWTASDYGIVKWTPTSGTQNFTVRVHDQDGNTVDVSWSVTVGTTWVAFVDAVNGNDSTGSGTFAAPWQTYGKAVASVSGGKAICFRAGTYTCPSSAVSLSSTTHNAMFAYPGEAVTMDVSTSTADAGCWTESNSDGYVIGINFSTGPTSKLNPRCFSNFAATDRMYKIACTFDSPPVGTAGSGVWDNQACWFLGDPGSQRKYIGVIGCTFIKLPNSGNGYMAIDTYNCKYGIFDECSFGAPYSVDGEQYTIFIKGGGNQEWSIRKNTFTQAWAPSNGQIGLYFGSDGTGTGSTNQEFCYNTLINKFTSNTWSSFACLINQAQNNASAVTAWSYRNTIVGTPCISKHSVNVLTFTSDNDVVVTDATASGATGKWLGIDFNGSANTFVNPTSIPSINYTINGTECHGGTGAGILDAGYLLTGSFRSSYLGLRGAEIA